MNQLLAVLFKGILDFIDIFHIKKGEIVPSLIKCHVCFQRGRKAPRWWDLHQRCELLPQGPGSQRLCRQAQVGISQKRVGCPSLLPLLPLLLLQYQKPACVWFHHDERDRAILSQRANQLLPVPPSLLSVSVLCFLDIPCGCAPINHLNFSRRVDWYVPTTVWWLCEMIVFDKKHAGRRGSNQKTITGMQSFIRRMTD